MNVQRPSDEYAPDSPRSRQLAEGMAMALSVQQIGAFFGVPERQAGYLLAIRARIIREEMEGAE